MQATANTANSDWHVRVEDSEVDIVCTIVCTADYCQGVAGDLGASVARMHDGPAPEVRAVACL